MYWPLLWAHKWRGELGLDLVHLALDAIFPTTKSKHVWSDGPNCQGVPDSILNIVLRLLVQMIRFLFYELHLWVNQDTLMGGSWSLLHRTAPL